MSAYAYLNLSLNDVFIFAGDASAASGMKDFTDQFEGQVALTLEVETSSAFPNSGGGAPLATHHHEFVNRMAVSIPTVGVAEEVQQLLYPSLSTFTTGAGTSLVAPVDAGVRVAPKVWNIVPKIDLAEQIWIVAGLPMDRAEFVRFGAPGSRNSQPTNKVIASGYLPTNPEWARKFFKGVPAAGDLTELGWDAGTVSKTPA
ncbi:MAG: hypothetical protein AAGG50_11120 [Bacteroidota bacterium]